MLFWPGDLSAKNNFLDDFSKFSQMMLGRSRIDLGWFGCDLMTRWRVFVTSWHHGERNHLRRFCSICVWVVSGGAQPPRPPQLLGRCRGLRRPGPHSHRLWSAAVAASEGQCLGSRPRSAKISMSSQDDLGQGSACSALAMDPKQMEVRGLRPLGSNG